VRRQEVKEAKGVVDNMSVTFRTLSDGLTDGLPSPRYKGAVLIDGL
jgi:hypothetical protein